MGSLEGCQRFDGVRDGSQAFTGPEHVVIDITNRCNNNCIACWTRSPLLGDKGPDNAWHRQQLSRDVVLRLVNDLAGMGTKIIRFTGGGEPFLHPDIFDFIAAVKSHKIYCAVTTSLNMLDVKQAQQLIAVGLDELSVSLWASSAAEYVQTHPNKKAETFDKITEVLDFIGKKKVLRFGLPLIKRGHACPRVNILNVISNQNCTNVEAMYDYAREIKADAMYLAVVDPIEGSTDSLLLSDGEREAVLEACRKIQGKNARLSEGKRIFLDNFEGFQDRLRQEQSGTGDYDIDRVDDIPCYIGWFFCRVMADGKVVPCCRSVDLPMGNIKESSFKEIWYSRRYEVFRNKAKNLSKNDPYFRQIGCGRSCDNHMHNVEIHNRMQHYPEVAAEKR